MNRNDLVDIIARENEVSKAVASGMVTSAINAITDALKEGDSVQLIGFGSFKVTHREERIGRNPQTGDSIVIAASNVARFTPGKALKDAINE